MKLKKAIEELNEIHRFFPGQPDRHKAINLGVEAMEAIQRPRHTTIQAQHLVLKSETPEDESTGR